MGTTFLAGMPHLPGVQGHQWAGEEEVPSRQTGPGSRGLGRGPRRLAPLSRPRSAGQPHALLLLRSPLISKPPAFLLLPRAWGLHLLDGGPPAPEPQAEGPTLSRGGQSPGLAHARPSPSPPAPSQPHQAPTPRFSAPGLMHCPQRGATGLLSHVIRPAFGAGMDGEGPGPSCSKWSTGQQHCIIRTCVRIESQLPAPRPAGPDSASTSPQVWEAAL